MSESNVIYHVPKKDKWEFDEEVTTIFEDMLHRSIPQYEVMRKSVTEIACHYLMKQGTLIDLGSSKGETIAQLLPYFPDVNYHALECSEPMLKELYKRFSGCNKVNIHNSDLRRSFPNLKGVDVITSILTLMFVPLEYRLQLLKKIYDSLAFNGCFILVEKVIGSSADIDNLMVQNYLGYKASKGYSEYEIDRKRLSLEGVLVPVTCRWNIEMLKASGFTQIDVFWRWFNFVGILAIK